MLFNASQKIKEIIIRLFLKPKPNCSSFGLQNRSNLVSWYAVKYIVVIIMVIYKVKRSLEDQVFAYHGIILFRTFTWGHLWHYIVSADCFNILFRLNDFIFVFSYTRPPPVIWFNFTKERKRQGLTLFLILVILPSCLADRPTTYDDMIAF